MSQNKIYITHNVEEIISTSMEIFLDTPEIYNVLFFGGKYNGKIKKCKYFDVIYSGGAKFYISLLSVFLTNFLTFFMSKKSYFTCVIFFNSCGSFCFQNNYVTSFLCFTFFNALYMIIHFHILLQKNVFFSLMFFFMFSQVFVFNFFYFVFGLFFSFLILGLWGGYRTFVHLWYLETLGFFF